MRKSSKNQTTPDKNIQKLAGGLKSKNFDLIFDIFDLVHKKVKNHHQSPDKKIYFRRRTAAEIFQSGISYGCTDYAMATLALLKVKKVKSYFVETFSKKWLEQGGQNIAGHVFVEFYLQGKKYIANPEAKCILRQYANYIVYKRGADSWALGICNFQDMADKANDFRKKFNKQK